MRLCAGASPWDLMDVHGISTKAMCYACLWQVVDAVAEKRSEVGPKGFPVKPRELEDLEYSR